MPRPRSPHDATIVTRFGAGETARAIAESLGVSTALVHKALRRNNAAPEPSKLSPEVEQVIVERYTTGVPAEALAADLEISKGTVYNVLRRNGLGPHRKMYKLTVEQETVIIQRVQAGETVMGVSRDFDVCNQTIHNMLAKRGITEPKSPLDATQRLLVVGECLSGTNIPETARRFNVSETTVSHILREYRAEGGEVPMLIGHPPTCEIDHAAFDVLTEESVYWHGFLFADGCLHTDRYGAPVLAIGLAEKDRGHLEKLRTFLKSTHTIYRQPARPGGGRITGGPSVHLHVRSKQIYDTLKARGMILKGARVPAAELASSRFFWRGMIDGDGSVGSKRLDNGTIIPTFMLSGRAPLLAVFQQYLREHALADLSQSPTQSGIFTVGTGGAKAHAVIKHLYQKATVVLDRKNERAQAIITGNFGRFAPYGD